jgi:hypothetical protein
MAIFGGRLVDARVTAVNWTRTMQLERQQWVARQGTLLPPDGARNVKKHTETYWAAPGDPLTGGPSLPGGPSMPGMPAAPGAPRAQTELRTRVYYTYEVREGRKSRLLRASGATPGDVRWPEYTPEPGEVVRNQVETYMVTFAAAGKQYEKSLPEQEWRAFAPGDACRLTLGLLGRVKKAAPARG